ncbi:PilZ domain-containing protein [Insolitispirillum peregrinum]|uniref:PilZ domain-containing protein n=1 Tax=Insolitispirillum peregrinum TaxID=80876 RepID=UPI00362230E4
MKEPTGSERRIFDRWSLDGAARVIFENQYDFSCKIKDMSASGVSVDTDIRPEIGDRAVVYVKGVGRLHAEVVRVREQDVALHFVVDNDRQRAILERLEREVVSGIERHLVETLNSLSGSEDEPE